MKKEWIRNEDGKLGKRRRKCPSKRQEEQIALGLPIQYSSNVSLLNPDDRTRLSNLLHCYDQFFLEASLSRYVPAPNLVLLRLNELFIRKRPIYVNFVSFFKHLPEAQTLHVDDQVLLIKQNIRLIMSLNYAIFRTPNDSPFRCARIRTIDCVDNINMHEVLRDLAESFVEFVAFNPLLIKLLIVVLFFTTNSLTTRAIYDFGEYKHLNLIQRIQQSYLELFWLYMLEKYGEKTTVRLYTRMIMKYLHIQMVIDQMDRVIEMNHDLENLDSLMKTMLQLT